MNENDDENEMNFLFVLHMFVSVCVVKKGGTITTRQRNGVLFVLVSFAALNLFFFFLLIILVIVCGVVCESESSVIVVVLVR